MLMPGRRKISEEMYERNKNNPGRFLCDEDMDKVFSQAEQCGYGVYLARVYKDANGTCYVTYEMGDSCD